MDSLSEPRSLTKNWEFEFVGWDKQMQTSVSKWCEDAKHLFEMLNLNATAEDQALWPVAGWGTKQRAGAIRAFAEALGRWKDYFIERVTETKLKSMKDVSEFLVDVVKVNFELANQARQLTIKKSQYIKPQSLEETFQMARQGPLDQRAQDRFLAGKNYNQTSSGTPLGQHRPERDAHEKSPGRHPDMSPGRQHENINRPYKVQPYNRLRDLEGDSVQSPDDVARMAQVHPDDTWDMTSAFDGFPDDYESSLYELIGTPRQPPPGKALFDGKVSPRPHPSSMPCFANARGECHNEKCPYSHDALVYSNAMRKRLSEIAETLGKGWLVGEMEKIPLQTSKFGIQPRVSGQAPRHADAHVRSIHSSQPQDRGHTRSPPLPQCRPDDMEEKDESSRLRAGQGEH